MNTRDAATAVERELIHQHITQLSSIIGGEADAIIPIRCNGRAWKGDYPTANARNKILRTTWQPGRAL